MRKDSVTFTSRNRLRLKHVFVGKDTLANVTLEFQVSWVVPPFVTRRIQATIASGKWGHLSSLFDSGGTKCKWTISSI